MKFVKKDELGAPSLSLCSLERQGGEFDFRSIDDEQGVKDPTLSQRARQGWGTLRALRSVVGQARMSVHTGFKLKARSSYPLLSQRAGESC